MREKSWEYEGKNIDEAVETALEELGLERDDVHIEVLEEPQKGFLGIGGKEARIRVDLLGEWEVARKPKDVFSERIDEDITGEQADLSENTVKPLKVVNEILDLLAIEAMVEAKETEETVLVDVWGEDVAILIGRGGNTLEALQYLVNVFSRRKGEVRKRIIIDIEGYRKRRKSRLEKQAEQTARKVLSEGKSVELPSMSASDRKTIHIALRSFNGICTESIGDDPDRRVVVKPIDSSST